MSSSQFAFNTVANLASEAVRFHMYNLTYHQMHQVPVTIWPDYPYPPVRFQGISKWGTNQQVLARGLTYTPSRRNYAHRQPHVFTWCDPWFGSKQVLMRTHGRRATTIAPAPCIVLWYSRPSAETPHPLVYLSSDEEGVVHF